MGFIRFSPQTKLFDNASNLQMESSFQAAWRFVAGLLALFFLCGAVAIAQQETGQISGTVTWMLATVIIWGASLLAAFLLPAFVFKKWLATTPPRAAR